MFDYSLVKKWTELPDGMKPYRVLFVHYASEGAQGGLWNSAYVVYDTGAVYFVDCKVTGVSYLPMVDEWMNGPDHLIPQGWGYQYMGAFNHLFVNKRVEKRFRELTSSFKECIDYYLNWLDLAIVIAAEMNEARRVRIANNMLQDTLNINGHTAVDLGLSVRWASCNVGASSPEDCGDYFAWGEVAPKDDYSPDNYQFSRKAIGDDIASTSHDVARELWGDAWRMPTMYEFDELLTECTWKWTVRKRKGSLRLSRGYKVTGPNGNSIFLPAAGCYIGSRILGHIPDDCYYWSSWLNVYFDNSAQCLSFRKRKALYTCWKERYCGCPVRPVIE